MALVRIAVLECDTPIPRVRAKYGVYSDIFRNLLQTAATNLHPAPKLSFTAYDVVNGTEYPELEIVDAILLSGSKYNSYDDDEWILALIDFVKKVLTQKRVRLIGVCFGHQIISRALGSDLNVCPNKKGWELSVIDTSLSPRGKQIFGVPKIAIHQFHRDVVYKCPRDVEIIGSTDACEIQGIYVHRKLFTVQGHPEFNGEIMTELLEARYQMGLFSKKLYEDAMSRANKHNDGLLVAESFLKFLLS